MIRFKPKGILSNGFCAETENGEVLLKYKKSYFSGSIEFDGKQYDVESKGKLSIIWSLRLAGNTVFDAERKGVSNKIAFQYKDKTLILSPSSLMGNGFHLNEGKERVMEFSKSGVFSRSFDATINDREIGKDILFVSFVYWIMNAVHRASFGGAS